MPHKKLQLAQQAQHRKGVLSQISVKQNTTMEICAYQKELGEGALLTQLQDGVRHVVMESAQDTVSQHILLGDGQAFHENVHSLLIQPFPKQTHALSVTTDAQLRIHRLHGFQLWETSTHEASQAHAQSVRSKQAKGKKNPGRAEAKHDIQEHKQSCAENRRARQAKHC